MGNSLHARQCRGRSRAALTGSITWMLTNSLVLYVTAICAQRVWTLLNSDVLQLLRRM